MKWDKFTVMAQEAFQQAQSRAEELGNQELKPEHLLWAFLNQEENIVNSVLAKIEVNPSKILEDLNSSLEKVPKVEGGGEVYLSSSLRKIMNNAQKEADKLKDEFISTEHLFIAVLMDKSYEASQIL